MSYAWSSSIAQSYGTIAMVKIGGTYDVYFDTEAKTIRLIPASGGNCKEGACIYDDGVINVTGTDLSGGELEEGVEEVNS